MKKLLTLSLALVCAVCLQGQNKLLDVKYYSHLYLNSQVNGMPAHLLFDTGSPYVCLDSIYFAQSTYKYKNLGNATMGGAGNNEKVKVKIIMGELTYIIGDEEYRSSVSPIVPLKPIVGDYIDGIMGITEIKNKAIVIDYKNKKMGFFDKLEEADIKGYTAIPLRCANNRFYVTLDVAINKDLVLSGEVLVDLGSGGGITFTSQIAKKYHLKRIKPAIYSYAKNGGIGGEVSVGIFRVQSCNIGGFEIEKPIAEFSMNTGGALADKEYMAIAGNDIWERFDLIIDPAGRKFYLRPNADFAKPFESPVKGFVYTDRSKTLGCWVVNSLVKDSNAEKAGLKISDRILKINGQSIKEIDIDLQQTLFNGINAVKLDVQRGEQFLEISFDFDSPKI